MYKKIISALLFSCLFLLLFTACNSSDELTQPSSSTDQEVNLDNSGETVADALADNEADHESTDDYSWSASGATQISLNRDQITVSGSGATASASTCTISAAGTYLVSGSLNNGQLLIDTDDLDPVKLVLNGASLNNSNTAPLFVKSAGKTVIILANNTENTITDGASYVFEGDDDEPNAALFSKDPLSFSGNGSLSVTGNYNDGITSKDGLIIAGGNITVKASDDGIRGKDYLVIKNGGITVNAGGDGLKSDNDKDETRGYIYIQEGTLNITAGGDAIAAETDALIAGGTLNLSAGGGSNKNVSGDASAKGIKALVQLIIDDGDLNIDSADDALHSNKYLTINDGSLLIASNDDGIHADSLLSINGSDINITKSYEGIESRIAILIQDGNIHLTSSDDGLNVAGGIDGSGWHGGGGPGGEDSGNYHLYIHGGYIVVNANGDGLDSNGSIEMTGGTVLVNGPTGNNNGALDHSSFKLTGGILVAAGSSGMAQAPSSTSTQYSVLVNFRSSQSAGTLFHVQTSAGNGILSFKPEKRYQSVVFSTPEIQNGETYEIYVGGSSTGTQVDGLYENGEYSPGTKSASLTVNNIVTKISG